LRLVAGGYSRSHRGDSAGSRASLPSPGNDVERNVVNLRLVEGAGQGRLTVGDLPAPMMAVAIAVLVIGSLVVLRSSQGAPPASEWSGVRVAASGQVANGQTAIGDGTVIGDGTAIGDVTVVARPGDSLWSIARRVAPGEDPRGVVASLREANGGDVVAEGQQIVIPEHLLD
jgi:hypothetical protein